MSQGSRGKNDNNSWTLLSRFFGGRQEQKVSQVNKKRKVDSTVANRAQEVSRMETLSRCEEIFWFGVLWNGRIRLTENMSDFSFSPAHDFPFFGRPHNVVDWKLSTSAVECLSLPVVSVLTLSKLSWTWRSASTKRQQSMHNACLSRKCRIQSWNIIDRKSWTSYDCKPYLLEEEEKDDKKKIERVVFLIVPFDALVGSPYLIAVCCCSQRFFIVAHTAGLCADHHLKLERLTRLPDAIIIDCKRLATPPTLILTINWHIYSATIAVENGGCNCRCLQTWDTITFSTSFPVSVVEDERCNCRLLQHWETNDQVSDLLPNELQLNCLVTWSVLTEERNYMVSSPGNRIDCAIKVPLTLNVILGAFYKIDNYCPVALHSASHAFSLGVADLQVTLNSQTMKAE